MHGPLASVVSTVPSSLSTEYLPTTCFNTIVDSSATTHLIPFKSAFLHYHSTPGGFVILADKTHISSIGIGTIWLELGSAFVKLMDVLHVPSKWSPRKCVRELAEP